MKAAVIHQLGSIPTCEEFDAPIPKNQQEVLLQVKAYSIKQLDRMKVAGKHYTNFPSLPVVVGTDGAGMLDDGRRVYAWGKTGMLAEQALVEKDRWTLIPDGLSFEMAAALPNALIGSDAALLYRAKLQPGQTVLINGATGFTGKIAVQLAKLRGAAKVIVTGRNDMVLEELKSLGADEVISLRQDDQAIVAQIQQSYQNQAIDIVLDYLWGHPIALVMQALQSSSSKLLFVSVGSMAGADITLPSALLRSTQIELLGSGIGSIPIADIHQYMAELLPDVFKLSASGKIIADLDIVPLEEVSSYWSQKEAPGRRFVVAIG